MLAIEQFNNLLDALSLEPVREHNQKIMDNVSQIQPHVFQIQPLPKFEEPFVDSSLPVFNSKKHKETCDKNRANRKKKNRSKK